MARSTDYIGATGIGVSDLKRSAEFYKHALGMKQTMTFKLDYMDEIVLTHEGRNAVVLMHWTDGSARNYRDVPVKLVTMSAIRADAVHGPMGCEITRERHRSSTMNRGSPKLCEGPAKPLRRAESCSRRRRRRPRNRQAL